MTGFHNGIRSFFFQVVFFPVLDVIPSRSVAVNDSSHNTSALFYAALELCIISKILLILGIAVLTVECVLLERVGP